MVRAGGKCVNAFLRTTGIHDCHDRQSWAEMLASGRIISCTGMLAFAHRTMSTSYRPFRSFDSIVTALISMSHSWPAVSRCPGIVRAARSLVSTYATSISWCLHVQRKYRPMILSGRSFFNCALAEISMKFRKAWPIDRNRTRLIFSSHQRTVLDNGFGDLPPSSVRRCFAPLDRGEPTRIRSNISSFR